MIIAVASKETKTTKERFTNKALPSIEDAEEWAKHWVEHGYSVKIYSCVRNDIFGYTMRLIKEL